MKLLNNLRDSNRWLRVLFVVLFAIIFYITQYLIFLVTLLQVFFGIFATNPNVQLQKLGAGLAEFTKELTRFITYNTNTKPFPFSDWPQGDAPEITETTVKSSTPSRKSGVTRTTATKKTTTKSSAKAAKSSVKKASTKAVTKTTAKTAPKTKAQPKAQPVMEPKEMDSQNKDQN